MLHRIKSRYWSFSAMRVALFVGLVFCSCSPAAAATDDVRELAGQILQDAGISGGLIVHLGVGDGRLTAELAARGHLVVQGLDVDPACVDKARRTLETHGSYGRLSAVRFDGQHLPYADDLVNLVVVSRPFSVPRAEVHRVLCPGGTAVWLDAENAITETFKKPHPADTDEWTHYLHDASGNPVAHDRRVGPPRRLQWSAGPPHTRSHEHIPSIYSLVSAGGRLFYIADLAPIRSIRQPPQWQLIARDAYNGIELWRQPLETWFPHIVNWGQTPPQLQRRLVAVGDRVYVTLGLHAPLSVLDAATGKLLATYPSTTGADEIVWHNGLLLVVVRPVTNRRRQAFETMIKLERRESSPLDKRETAEPLVKQFRTAEMGGPKTILALDADSGRVLWKKSGPLVAGLKSRSLCAWGDRAFYQLGRDVCCVDLKTGRKLWSASAPTLRLVHQDIVVCADGETVATLSARDGRVRWSQPAAVCQVRDAFVIGGALWIGGFRPWQGRTSGKRGPAWGPYFAIQRDLATGKILMEVEPDNPLHHHRCYANKATDRYILGGRRGTEFIDLKTGEVLWNSFARGVCKYGVMPANGLLYAPPHACACYMSAKLIGFNALASAERQRAGQQSAASQQQPASVAVERGPAFGRTEPQRSAAPSAGQWATYRCDSQRSGATTERVTSELHLRWQKQLGDRLTAPTVADGKVFAAATDRHRLVALDADAGKTAWQFTAGGRIDSPPTIVAGQAIFGCRDGYVYSLRTSDGAMAWRSKAARRDRWIIDQEQIESAWPVLGSVLFHDGVIFATAGRSSYLDGGIDVCRLDPSTGQILSRATIYSPDPVTDRQPKQSAPAVMPGARADILSADHEHVYLRDMVLDLEGHPREEQRTHLFTMTDYLDDSWAHRSYWIYGTHCSVAGGCSRRDKDLIYGRLLVVSPSTVYGYGRSNVHWSNQLEDGPYRVFALRREGGQPLWSCRPGIQIRAMLLAGDVLYLAGPQENARTRLVGYEGVHESQLLALSATDGRLLAELQLPGIPRFDGMAAAGGKLYVTTENGSVVCFGP